MFRRAPPPCALRPTLTRFTSLSPLLLPLLLPRICNPKPSHNVTNPRIYVAAAIVVAIVAAPDLRPETVANALQSHVFTSLSQLLLPLLLRRICDPKPSQNVTNPHVYGTAAIVVAIVVATQNP